ncbi:MAG: AAA family ATPase [Oligoflexia bacterium]|nr:AAA family ATPase [Oligoflexia bacterium]
MAASDKNHCCRIVLTGGPGGGKTTAADLFRREFGEQVVIVPEAATLLYMGGFPRSHEQEVRMATQKAIFHVQKNLEDIQAAHFKSRILLCDRGTLDGAAYWPSSDGDYFKHMGTTLRDEIERYDAVVFFETAAVGDIPVIEGGNPARVETVKEAAELDAKLKAIWSKHPRFHFIKHEKSFFHKISSALNIIENIVAEHSK